MAIKNDIKVVAPQDLPEVHEYLRGLEMWEALKNNTNVIYTSPHDILETARQIIENLEILRAAAEKAVRAAGVSCGPFKLTSSTLSIDWDKVHATKGREGFLRAGGVIKETVKFQGDVNRYMAAKAQGLITETEADEFEGKSLMFSVVKPYSMP